MSSILSWVWATCCGVEPSGSETKIWETLYSPPLASSEASRMSTSVSVTGSMPLTIRCCKRSAINCSAMSARNSAKSMPSDSTDWRICCTVMPLAWAMFTRYWSMSASLMRMPVCIARCTCNSVMIRRSSTWASSRCIGGMDSPRARICCAMPATAWSSSLRRMTSSSTSATIASISPLPAFCKSCAEPPSGSRSATSPAIQRADRFEKG